jgi:hypothetical protein
MIKYNINYNIMTSDLSAMEVNFGYSSSLPLQLTPITKINFNDSDSNTNVVSENQNNSDHHLGRLGNTNKHFPNTNEPIPLTAGDIAQMVENGEIDKNAYLLIPRCEERFTYLSKWNFDKKNKNTQYSGYVDLKEQTVDHIESDDDDYDYEGDHDRQEDNENENNPPKIDGERDI